MLKGIDPLLGPDLLHALAAMGHGDEIAIVDANFPAASTARRLLRIDGVGAPAVLAAVLSLLPLDTFTETPAAVMAVVGDPRAVPPPVREFQAILDGVAGKPVRLATLERSHFYERTRGAFAVVATGERRLYGNILVTKGVVPP
ncbi:MAG TPA: RbsD/FucU domain-containing protein [Stellaceae bacterium]|nr:RbsD/FucU domain-containing protein [Stellaceae bacterium]